MSYGRTPSPAPTAGRGELAVGQHAHHAEHPLTANAQAWRRLATVGYHRTAELVRATRPNVQTPDDALQDADTSAEDKHHSGFQGL
jgi:hypothetical protein